MIVRHRIATPTRAITQPAFRAPGIGVDRTFEQLTRTLFEPRTQGPAMHAGWDDDNYVLTVDLPGVPAANVGVEVTGTTLQVSATIDGNDWSRALRLGSSLDPATVGARYVDGRLTVRVEPFDAPASRIVTVDTSTEIAIDESTSADDQSSAGDQSSDTNSAD